MKKVTDLSIMFNGVYRLMKIHKQRVFACAFSILCAAAIAVQSFPGMPVSATSTAVTTDYLNLRQGAGTDTNNLLTLGKGVTLTILDNSNTQWAKVQTQSGKQGYCSKQYLIFSETAAADSGTSSSTSGTAVTTASLNMRSSASLSGNILLVISKGTAVTLLDNSSAQWAKVQTADGRQGWCSKEFLTISGASSGESASSGSSTSSDLSTTALTTDYLNMRQGAGTNYSVILTISKGTTVTILDDSNSQWAKIRTPNGKEGWCSKQYLQFSTSAGETASGKTVTATTTAALNMRSGTGLGFSILLTLPKGTTVPVTDNSNSQWAKVKASNGTEGWCSKQYLNLTVPKTSTSGNTTGSSPSSSSSSPSPNSSSPSSSSSSSSPNSSSPSSSSGSPNESGDSTDTTGGSDSRAITGATVTADVLRLREQPSASSQIVDNLPNGTLLTVLDISMSGWVKVQTSGGKTGYVSADYVTLRYEGDAPAETGGNSSSVSLSSVSQTVPIGKTLFLKATTNPSGGTVSWKSSNSTVATVSNGYVLAVSKGSAVITASSGSEEAACAVTVTDAEPVRTAYAAPNVAKVGEPVTLTAVTDASRDGVRFSVAMPDGTTKAVTASNAGENTVSGMTTKKWTGTVTFDKAGKYSFTAYSSIGGSYGTTGFSADVLVSSQSDYTVSTNEERRVSDDMLKLIAKWEGSSATVYTDTMASNQVATIGYGYTLSSNETFYNNLSEAEMWSLLVKRINGTYTGELNKMIQNDHFLMSQNQADCLLSFAYNVGAGYFNSSNKMDFIKMMKNAVVPPDIPAGESIAATVTQDCDVLDNTGTLSGKIASLSEGTSVQVTGTSFSSTRNGWYQATLSDGTEGWINSGYVSLSGSDSMTHDLNYTNAYAFGSELIRWNLAGGKFYTGLFYRRLGEANVFNYGDYSAIRYNEYGYKYPSTASGLD